ncbi:MAG: hypothetical protein NT169_04710 [Chloroflexi bacterium]|nr:hypothetical protein [Chloroflexota bacterium]
MILPHRVAGCGDSLLLTILAESLGVRPDQAVTRLAPRQPAALTQFAARRPDVALVERGEAGGDSFILSLLHDHPDPSGFNPSERCLLMIGRDPNHSGLTVLSSRQAVNRLKCWPFQHDCTHHAAIPGGNAVKFRQLVALPSNGTSAAHSI